MKLYAEQIQYLRRRKKELLAKLDSYTEFCQNRENGGLDGLNYPHFFDYQLQADNSYSRSELSSIDQMLMKGEFHKERNFDFVDIGTAFYAVFDDGSRERTMLVDCDSTIAGHSMYASIESDFGKSVLGKKEGEQVTYKVSATGRMIQVSIAEIDRVRDHYLHFIRETAFTDRICNPVSNELKKLKVEDPIEYEKRHALSPSQIDLLKEELYHIKGKDLRRQNFISKLLAANSSVDYPTGPTIQVGSMVEIALQDGNQDPTIHQFEFINQAVSTEIEGDYVERISTLGNAIYGLKEGDTFFIRRSHLPSVKGVVTKVENCGVKKRVH